VPDRTTSGDVVGGHVGPLQLDAAGVAVNSGADRHDIKHRTDLFIQRAVLFSRNS
jgi:hypothetical protein